MTSQKSLMKDTSVQTMNPDTEIRKLRPAEFYTLGQILNVSDSWKRLMAMVIKEWRNDGPVFNSEHLIIIEQAGRQQQRNAAEIFLEEWCTMGRRNPTLRSILDLLIKAELFRAADYIAVNLLNEEPPQRPKCGPAAEIDVSDEAVAKLLDERMLTIEYKTESTCLIENDGQVTRTKDEFFEPITSLNHVLNSPDIVLHPSTLDSSCCQIIQENGQRREMNVIGNSCMALPKLSITDTENNSSTVRTLSGKIVIDSDKVNFQCQEGVTFDRTNILTNDGVSFQVNGNKEQELLSRELPACLADFSQVSLRQELTSKELPLCVNEITRLESNRLTSSDNNNSGVTTNSISSGCLPNFEAIAAESTQNYTNASSRMEKKMEMTSLELPQCVVELGLNSVREIYSCCELDSEIVSESTESSSESTDASFAEQHLKMTKQESSG